MLLEWLVQAAWGSQGLIRDPNGEEVELGGRQNQSWWSGSWAGQEAQLRRH